MVQIPKRLERSVRRSPEKTHRVVITVAEESELSADDLGLEEAREIAPGIYAGRGSGHRLLKLSSHEEIAEIVDDAEEFAHESETDMEELALEGADMEEFGTAMGADEG